MTLLTGTLLARGRRTVTAALRASGNAQAGNWSLFRPCAQPSSLVTAFGEPPTAPVDRRDMCASRSLCGPGHRRNAGAALGQQDQFLCVLATTPQASERLGKQHKTIGMWAHQMISLVGRWLPDRRQTADGRYGLQRPAIERSTPLLFALSSLVTLFARAMHPDGHIPVRVSAWYRKQSATFCDVYKVKLSVSRTCFPRLATLQQRPF
jgi:hypothetical protein